MKSGAARSFPESIPTFARLCCFLTPLDAASPTPFLVILVTPPELAERFQTRCSCSASSSSSSCVLVVLFLPHRP
uniref:Uncharacterized protein n=1 Tax=Physcomitrium patens TaxID=3218 RepID=A0A2K1KUG9_PHYPA|nr:hypothetical protein PHYPA_004428 [Physcomitrium patens]